jgi:hypothetical protein
MSIQTIKNAIQEAERFKKATAKMSESIIAKHRALCDELVAADKTGDVGTVSIVIRKLMLAMETSDMSRIEMLLRFLNCRTWLVALDIPVVGCEFLTYTHKEAPYYMEINMKDEVQNALMLLRTADSYGVNLLRLTKTGVLTLKNIKGVSGN